MQIDSGGIDNAEDLLQTVAEGLAERGLLTTFESHSWFGEISSDYAAAAFSCHGDLVKLVATFTDLGDPAHSWEVAASFESARAPASFSPLDGDSLDDFYQWAATAFPPAP